jgi:hypothetical protein
VTDIDESTDCGSHLSLGDDPLLFPGMAPTGLLSLLWTLGRRFRGFASYPISRRGMLFERDIVCYEKGGGGEREVIQGRWKE